MRIRKTTFVLCGVLTALLSAVPAMAAFDTYITFTGARQGPIKGNDGLERMRVISVVRDTPMATRMPTGRRMHSTITITREVDAASPKLFQALSTNESLKTVTIAFEGASGGPKTAQKIVLTNARIVNIRKSGRNEIITLDYESIEVTWTDGGKTSADDWETPS
jgi:type VI secretion system secreted protein Hcp